MWQNEALLLLVDVITALKWINLDSGMSKLGEGLTPPPLTKIERNRIWKKQIPKKNFRIFDFFPPFQNKKKQKAWTSLIGLREHHNYYQHTVIRMCSWKKCDLKLRMTEMCDIFLFSMLILFLHYCAAYLQGDRRLTH